MNHHVPAVTLTVKPEDFPGRERLASEVIKLLRRIYRHNAMVAMQRHSRGSILLYTGRVYTRDMLDDMLGL